jgi:hypothetical protein
MHSVFESPDPAKQSQREALAAQIAEYERTHGPIVTQPLKDIALGPQPYSINIGGKARNNRQEWKEGA